MKVSRKRLSDRLAENLRTFIAEGKIEDGAYLPPERTLERQFKVSRVTVRRALSSLVREGLIESVPSCGYRPVRERARAERGTLAYVLSAVGPGDPWDSSHARIFAAFNRAAFDRRRKLLGAGARGRDPVELYDELAGSDLWGVVLDGCWVDLAREAMRRGHPCVVVDSFLDHRGIDVVLQDNFNGARTATEYLLERGHDSIGWVGTSRLSDAERARLNASNSSDSEGGRNLVHYRERFAGSCAAMYDYGKAFDPKHLVEVQNNEARGEAREKVAKLLAGKNRPRALVCMWQQIALGAIEAVRGAGLKFGTDIDLVFWSSEEEYRETFAPEFLGESVPAAVLWRPQEMAELALQRLEMRAAYPHAPACRTYVPARLVEPQPAEEVLRRSVKLEKTWDV